MLSRFSKFKKQPFFKKSKHFKSNRLKNNYMYLAELSDIAIDAVTPNKKSKKKITAEDRIKMLERIIEMINNFDEYILHDFSTKYGTIWHIVFAIVTVFIKLYPELKEQAKKAKANIPYEKAQIIAGVKNTNVSKA